METMKALAVIPVVGGVLRSEFLDMKQQRDQNFRSFVAKVRGKAETCAFMTQSSCPCGITNSVDYTDNIVRDVLIAGVYDVEIHRDILGIDGILDKSVNGVVSLI